MKKAIISVIVAVYNVEDYIRRSIESVCSQTFEELEIILIDDGSTDKSGEICDEFAKRDKRIKVIHQQNQGLSCARNTGIEAASCDFIGFVDGDDYLEPDMFELLYKNLCNANADISTCASDRVKHTENASFTPVIYNREQAIYEVLQNPFISVYAWNKLYKKKLFNSVRYPKGKIYEDSFVILDLIEQIDKMVSTAAPKYHYTQREESITNKRYNTAEEDRISSAEKNYNFIKDKYPKHIKAAMSRYVFAHYICLGRILHEEKGLYLEKEKEHLAFLRKNLFFVLFNWPKNYFLKITPPFYLKVLFPSVYRFLRNKKQKQG